jgi:hypothetical protein
MADLPTCRATQVSAEPKPADLPPPRWQRAAPVRNSTMDAGKYRARVKRTADAPAAVASDFR